MRLGRFGIVLLLCVPVGELIAHARVQRHVLTDEDVAAAATFVKKNWRPRDLVTSAPSWTDPILRLHLGSLITLDMAGRHDDSAYERIWVLSMRGKLPADVPAGAKPELDQRFGEVRLLRYGLGKSPVRFDFVDQLPAAHVALEGRDCPYRKGGVPRGGGLGKGVLYPLSERFDCDPRRPWLFVGRVVMEDLDVKPRRCIWQHAAGDAPVSTTFDDVPLGDELILYAGLYYEHERMRDGGPVRVDVFVNGQRRMSMVHHDGEGFRRMRVATGAVGDPERGQVRIDVTAPAPDRRSLCWAASTRTTPPAGARP